MGSVESTKKKIEKQNIRSENENITGMGPSIASNKSGDVEADQRQITVIIVGAGMRGQIYAKYAVDFPSRMKVVGVAEPIRYRREMIKNLYEIDEDYVFNDWKDVSEAYI